MRELAWRLGRAFCSLCHSLRAYWSDRRAVAEILCEAAERMDDRRALGIAGNLDWGQGYLIGAVTAFKGEEDRWWATRTRRNLAELRLAQRRPEEARELLEEALGVFECDRNCYRNAGQCSGLQAGGEGPRGSVL
ncbi:hypothetical protein ACIBF6_28285 [Streptosporangium amethystogenes]|uniref:hypothetical protein n=1 Tax=Streptosporangium amethystogenes TaxID=2002 RepID=UPI0037B52D5A